MKINGENVTLDREYTVEEYLRENEYRPEMVAVELNEEILPKKLYSETVLKEEDVMEIVMFMGGG